KQKALFQTAFNADHNACSITVLETGKFIDVNDAWCRVRGWQREDVIGKTALELNVWGDPDKRLEIVKEVQKKKSKGRYETTVNSPINGVRNLVLSWSIIFVNDTECLFLSTMDITERKKIEKEKEESERLFKTIFEKAPIGLALYQNDTNRLVIANQEYSDIVGISGEEEFLDWRDITHPGDLQEDEENYKKFVEGEIDGYSMEKRYIHADGQMKRAELNIVSIRSEQDELSQQHLAMLADITDRYELEERLQQSQKMEAVGQLTGGIAHDFNNLLAVIQGNTELVREMVVAKRDIRVSQIDSILRAAERGAELTHSMLAFSRKQALNPVNIKLDQQVKTTIDILRRTLGETISIHTLFAPDLWPCRADPGKVENVLLNLGINARDAMPRGGDLIIEVCNAILAADEILGSSQAKPGKYVALSVKDTGTGISAEHLEHVFEPFFTTKEPGKGTGLGLSMVYGFAEQSDGYLTISSEQDKGTTVILYLPFADPEAS
ncbi:MAG: PAS domain S-box protein, partial [Sneathiella sp.]